MTRRSFVIVLSATSFLPMAACLFPKPPSLQLRNSEFLGLSLAQVVERLGPPLDTHTEAYTCPPFQNEQQVFEFWERSAQNTLTYEKWFIRVNGHDRVIEQIPRFVR